MALIAPLTTLLCLFKGKTIGILKSRRAGVQYGLRLTLNINASEYIGLLAPAYGIRVSIHSPDDAPVPEELGFYASPGIV